MTDARSAVTITEQHDEESTRSTESKSADRASPATRRVRPSVLYLFGRPAQLWVNALGRGTVTIAR